MSDFEALPCGTLARLHEAEAEIRRLTAHLEQLRETGDRIIKGRGDPVEWNYAITKTPGMSLQEQQLARLTVIEEATAWIFRHHPSCSVPTLALLSHYARMRRKWIMASTDQEPADDPLAGSHSPADQPLDDASHD